MYSMYCMPHGICTYTFTGTFSSSNYSTIKQAVLHTFWCLCDVSLTCVTMGVLIADSTRGALFRAACGRGLYET